MNTIIPVRDVVDQVNRCYLDYAEWPSADDAAIMNAFKYRMEQEAGLRLTFTNSKDRFGRHGYSLEQVELIDEQLYLVWMLRWT